MKAATVRAHGTHAKYIIEKCRCVPCKAAGAAAAKRRRYLNLTGRPAYVDATRAREHVASLRSAGMGWRNIAQVSGMSYGAVSKLVYGDRGRPPSKRITPANERKLLAVQLERAEGALVPAVGTQRRIQALVAIGWSGSRVMNLLGMEKTEFTRIMAVTEVRKRTHRDVCALYDRLWNAAPPSATHHQRVAVSRSINMAKARGWSPPLAWDDDEIDDPAATPDGAAPVKRHGKLPPADDLQFLMDCGESTAAIAQRFKVKVNTVEQALSRAGRAA